MTDKKTDINSEPGVNFSRRIALQKFGLGAAAFVVPLVTTVSDAQAGGGERGDHGSDKSSKSGKSGKSGKSNKSRKDC